MADLVLGMTDEEARRVGRAKSWAQRIAEAREEGGFTQQDVDLAGSWVTCACGERDDILHRGENDVPKDEVLYRLGMRFLEAVEQNRTGRAEEVLEEIEERAAQLLEEGLGRDGVER